MATGFVKRLMKDKGFGFIRDERGIEYFFHRSGLKGVQFEELQENQTVSFVVTTAAKGPRAEDIQVMPDEETNG